MFNLMAHQSVSTETIFAVTPHIHSLGPMPRSLKSHDVRHAVRSYGRSMDDYLKEIRELFGKPLELDGLLELSRKLQAQFKVRLRADTHCMLPSFNHTLPHGDERGTFAVLDVGGSTLRVALVELCGRFSVSGPMRIVRMETSCIDSSVRALEGFAFFDWLAARFEHLLAKAGVRRHRKAAPLHLGVAWSFPLA